MRRFEIQRRAERHDAARIDVAHADVIVPLDVIHVHRLGHARHLIKLAHIVRDVRIVDDAAQVAFEMAVVDGIKANQRREQSPIGFGQALAAQISVCCEPVLQPVRRRKERAYDFLARDGR